MDKIEVTLANGDMVTLKKDSLGYRVIEPPSKWYHYIFGSKRNLVNLIIILAIATALYFGVQDLLAATKSAALSTCKDVIINITG
jgi:hypothetical protein